MMAIFNCQWNKTQISWFKTCFFCTWLFKRGVTIDVIREFVGYKNRLTTNRYATLTRLELSKYLSFLPDVREVLEKEMIWLYVLSYGIGGPVKRVRLWRIKEID